MMSHILLYLYAVMDSKPRLPGVRRSRILLSCARRPRKLWINNAASCHLMWSCLETAPSTSIYLLLALFTIAQQDGGISVMRKASSSFSYASASTRCNSCDGRGEPCFELVWWYTKPWTLNTMPSLQESLSASYIVGSIINNQQTHIYHNHTGKGLCTSGTYSQWWCLWCTHTSLHHYTINHS